MKLRNPAKDLALPAGFGRLLIAWFAAQSADGMRFAALPLLAFTTNGSPSAVATVATATALPWLLVALPAGILVDRLDPARVIAWANLVRALAAGLVVGAIASGMVSITLLAVIGFVLTAAETFADSAAQSLLVRIVPHDQLERANARFVSSENVGLDLVGPLLAGALFSFAHWLPFAISAVTFLVAAGVILTFSGASSVGGGSATGGSSTGAAGESGGAPDGQRGRHARAEPMDTHSASVRSSVFGAFRAIFVDPILRSLVITVAILAATVAAMEGVLVIYATGPLGLKGALFPTLLAAYSVGLLGSAGLVPRTVRRFGSGPVMLTALGLVSTTLILLGTFPSPLLAWICFVVMGAAGGFWNILSATRRQRRTPVRMAASVSSAFRAMAWGAVPLGTALGGVGAQHWGVARVFVVAGLVLMILAVAMSRALVQPDKPASDSARPGLLPQAPATHDPAGARAIAHTGKPPMEDVPEPATLCTDDSGERGS